MIFIEMNPDKINHSFVKPGVVNQNGNSWELLTTVAASNPYREPVA